MRPSKEERTVALRRRVLLAGWLLTGLVILGRSVQVQVVQGAEWSEEAGRQHRRTMEVPAPRGAIRDRDGVALVLSHESYRVEVAPGELEAPDEAAAALVAALDLSERDARRVVRSDDPWIVIPGRFAPRVRLALGGITGIYLTRELPRFRPHAELAMGVLGRFQEERGRGGIEQAFDSILAGRPGQEIQARDHEGRPIPGQSFLLEPPVAGGEVTLTLDMDLQEIGHEALEAAIEETGARGGDLLVTDPRTGEILAMVSLSEGREPGLSAINTPYEPGSTLKPFTVAAVLRHGLVSMDDSVDTGEGWWRTAGRTLRDVHPKKGWMTLATALRVSSNVGVARFAESLTRGQQYENLRDFGFGTRTGIPLPGEDSGRLPRPEGWSAQSPASLAIGYEVSVTPIQMAMAYGALANGGILMEPRLVRTVTTRDGRTQRIEPRAVRRVVSESVTREVNRVLVDVVEDGTGTRARMSTFAVAGKSGTSRAYGAHGYAPGEYYASFVGFFPAEDPQLVVYVKLDRPRGAYYGGATAAPVTRATMEAALAARQPPLDRRALASIARRNVETAPTTAPDRRGGSIRFASRLLGPAAPSRDPVPPVRTAGDRVPVPDVSGLPARVAARRLHAMGFRVRLDGSGAIVRTSPPVGLRLPPGDTVVVHGRGGG